VVSLGYENVNGVIVSRQNKPNFSFVKKVYEVYTFSFHENELIFLVAQLKEHRRNVRNESLRLISKILYFFIEYTVNLKAKLSSKEIRKVFLKILHIIRSLIKIQANNSFNLIISLI